MPSVFAMLLCALSMVADSSPARSSPEVGHVRPLDAFSRALLREGVFRSPTIARFVHGLDRSNVVTYVRADLDPQIRTASTRFMVAAGGLRYLLVAVNPRNSHDALLALLGHELEHATEVAGAPRVVDQASFLALYERIGQRSLSGREYETTAAHDAGRAVMMELENGSQVAARATAAADRRQVPQ